MNVNLTDYEIRTLVLAAAYLQANIVDIEIMHEEHPFDDFIVQGRALPLPAEPNFVSLIERLRATYG